MKTLRNGLGLFFVLTLILAAESAPACHRHPPQVGDRAPRVGGKNQDGQRWSVSTDFGKKVLLVYFYSRDSAPESIAEATAMRNRMNDLKTQGVDVVGISFDSVASHKQLAFDYDLNFPLIADTDGHIADAFGARQAPRVKMDRPVSFLIGLDGKVAYITDWPDPLVQLEQLRLAIKNLNAKS